MPDDKTSPSDEHPAASDTRAARIAVLRKSIATGSYRISSDEIAGKIVEDMLRKP